MWVLNVIENEKVFTNSRILLYNCIIITFFTSNFNINTMNTSTLKGLKPTEPFSQRLNDWIKNRTENIMFVSGNFPEVDFKTFKSQTANDGYMKISNEFCENTIFGDVETNVAFRAWHDSIHLELNEGFDYMEEARVAFKQIAELPQDWEFERQLILIEIIGQAAYHNKTGNFVPNQRLFTIECLENGKI